MSEKYYRKLYLQLVEKNKALEKELNVWREIKRRQNERRRSTELRGRAVKLIFIDDIPDPEQYRGITIQSDSIIHDDIKE